MHARVLDRASAEAERLSRRLEELQVLLGPALDGDLGLAAKAGANVSMASKRRTRSETTHPVRSQ